MITCDICDLPKEETMFYFDSRNENNRKTTCIKCFNKTREGKDPRRKQDGSGVEMVLYKKLAKEGTSKKIYNGSTAPTFLQYNQMIQNHVYREHRLAPDVFNFMLLLYPVVPFTKQEFFVCRKMANIKNSASLKNFIDDGWVYQWRVGLYDFSDKGFKLMKDAHLWALGKKVIPDTVTEDVMDIIRRIQRRNK